MEGMAKSIQSVKTFYIILNIKHQTVHNIRYEALGVLPLLQGAKAVSELFKWLHTCSTKSHNFALNVVLWYTFSSEVAVNNLLDNSTS